MSLPSFATQSVTVLRAGTITDHGATVQDWSNPVAHAITGCSVQPGGGAEDLLHGDVITILYTIFAPLDADVVDTDRVVVGGVAYDIDGPVKRWETGVLDHIEVPLKGVGT